LRYFEQAIARDPNYALAYSGVCDTYSVLAFMGGSRSRDVFLKCREAATRAVAVDDSLAEGHASLGMVRAVADWNWREAEREFRRAIERNPRYFQARTWFAFQVLGPLGRWDEAVAEVRAALEMEPLSATANHHGAMVALQRRRPDEVIAYTRTTLELDPGFLFAHLWLGMAYEMQERYDEAIGELTKAVETLGESMLEWRATIAHALAKAGRHAEAEKLLEELKQWAERRYIDPFWLGVVHAGLGESDHAMDYLERAADDRSFHMLMSYPSVDPLRMHPRFVELMSRVGLPALPRE
jgi:serine/threonine-protein kinase